MDTVLKIACLQINSGKSIQNNVEKTCTWIERAAGQGANLISTPENTDFIRMRYTDMRETAMTETDHPGIHAFSNLARDKAIWLHIGSLTILNDDGTLSNRSYVFNPDGDIAATYNKIHMFDVTLDNGETYRESKAFKPGEKAVTLDTPWGRLGLTICYDLRFPSLYRTLGQKDVDIIFVPAAFTVPTGKAHWETLLRARAIENNCYIVAAAQAGDHEGEKQTYGHSMIIHPWGEVIASLDDQEDILYAEIDLAAVSKARKAIPSLRHDRDYSL